MNNQERFRRTVVLSVANVLMRLTVLVEGLETFVVLSFFSLTTLTERVCGRTFVGAVLFAAK